MRLSSFPSFRLTGVLLLSGVSALTSACGLDSEGATAASEMGGGGKAGSPGAAGKSGAGASSGGAAAGGGSAGKGGGGTGGAGGKAGGGGSGGGGGLGKGGGANGGSGGSSGTTGGSAGSAGASGKSGGGGTAAGAGGNGGKAGGSGGAPNGGAAGAPKGGAAGASGAGSGGAPVAGAGGSPLAGAGGAPLAGAGGAPLAGAGGAPLAGAGGAPVGGAGGAPVGGAGGAPVAGAGGAGNGGAPAGGSGGAGGGPTCGDGLVNQLSEQCDDANNVETDACTNDCLVRCEPSPAGFLAPGSHRCFYLVGTSDLAAPVDTYGGTDTVCTGPGAHIAVFADPRDALWVSGGSAVGAPRAWVGAKAVGSQDDSRDDFAWFEGGPIDDVIWQEGQPDTSGGELCIDLRAADVSGQLRFRVGDNGCVADTGEVPLVGCIREPVCRVKGLDGVVGAGGHCYIVGPNALSKAAAKTFCAGLGGHLATFETFDELRHLGGYGLRELWVGATQTAPPSAQPNVGLGWTWGDGPTPSKPLPPEVWVAGQEPNDGGGGKTKDTGAEDCAAFFGATRRLHDTTCNNPRAPLCEIE